MSRLWPRRLAALGLACIALASLLYLAGDGRFGQDVVGGRPSPARVPPKTILGRTTRQAQVARALSFAPSKQILFGDLHVHSSFSTDAFQLTLPMSGGEGVHPVADACDFARFCADLDFFSINDHANSLTQRRWRETVDAIRECNRASGAPSDRADRDHVDETARSTPDLVAFLGWEWTQMGSTPANHFGHKNVVLRDLADDAIPARPISAAAPEGVPSAFSTDAGGPLARGLAAFAIGRGHDAIRQLEEIRQMERCPAGVPVRSLPLDCSEAVATPDELFAKLDEWGYAATVIPHGTVWGMYTPAGSSFAKQLRPGRHDPARQRLVEVYSGHGNAEEFRSWVAAEIAEDGSRRCPEPSEVYTPSCWRAGEIMRARCLAEAGETARGSGSEAASECARRAALARQHFVDADRNAGPRTVPGLAPHELGNAGQCLDCFQPAFNYRPLGSVQHMLALGRPGQSPGLRAFHFGFIASSDNHTARPRHWLQGAGATRIHRRPHG